MHGTCNCKCPNIVAYPLPHWQFMFPVAKGQNRFSCTDVPMREPYITKLKAFKMHRDVRMHQDVRGWTTARGSSHSKVR